ncbi:ATP-binding protein [Polynucleobacter necessarius]|uniref:ATP-binding protein n=1 Tax=Polynucleobacter necessarius TaxID=576610 RepID=UPI000E09A764|nr:ATP-binding protein [Polynucleobacter necessarius]
MTCKLTHSAPRLILFAGHAGTGKSTLAKKTLPLLIEKTGEDFFFLDKGTAYGAFSAHVMQLTTGNPNDRDSPYYLENLRDWEYQGPIDIARENLLLGVNVVLVGPFSKEIQSGEIFDAQARGLPPQTTIQIAWIDLEESEAKRRIEKRADPRDNWKLDRWKQYTKRRTEPPAHSALHRFDNSVFSESDFEKFMEDLV